MNYKLSKNALNQIKRFYRNVAKRYQHTWTKEDVKKYTSVTKQSIYQIENGLQRRNPTIARWQGLYMATSKDRKWNFAYRIENDTIYVEDACHSQNMHESKNVIRLTENQFIKLISESFKSVLQDYNCESVRKDSYKAKPKKDGRLNDWEIENIFSRIVIELVSSKQISPEDGNILLYYGLYNNDCFSHIDS